MGITNDYELIVYKIYLLRCLLRKFSKEESRKRHCERKTNNNAKKRKVDNKKRQ